MFARKLVLSTLGLAVLAAATVAIRPLTFQGTEGPQSAHAATVKGPKEAAALITTDDRSWGLGGNPALAATIERDGSVRVIIEVPAKADDAVALRRAQDRAVAVGGSGLVELERFKDLPYVVARVDAQALSNLRSSNAVVSITEDELNTPDLAESTTMIGAPKAFSVGATGKGWAVAILDTGFDLNHPFYKNRIVAQACFASTDIILGVKSYCPNGKDSQVGPGAASSAYCRAEHGCQHGTHVAGIVGGRQAKFTGVAPDATLILVNVFSNYNGSLSAFDSDQLRGLEYVLSLRNEMAIASVNMSLGGGRYASQTQCDVGESAFASMSRTLLQAGIPIIAAAGNDGYTDSLGAPGCISSVVGVGSIDKANVVAPYSNSSPMVDILAPGSDIVSSLPGGGYGALSGTSMATPHVAGAFAVIRSAFPGATPAEVLKALQTGAPITDDRNGLALPSLHLDTALAALSADPNPRLRAARPANLAPANDDFESLRWMNAESYRDVVSTRNATEADDDPYIEPSTFCPDGGYFAKTVWYAYAAENSGMFEVSTEGSNYDTVVAVWRVTTEGVWIYMGCNDDNIMSTTSKFSGMLGEGEALVVMVGAWDNGGTLDFHFDYSSFGGSTGISWSR